MLILFLPERFIVLKKDKDTFQYFTIYRDIANVAYWVKYPGSFGEKIAENLAERFKLIWKPCYGIPPANTTITLEEWQKQFGETLT